MTDRSDRPLTIDEAAALLGISPEGVRSRLRRGQLAGERQGRTWVIFSVEPVTVSATGRDRSDHLDRPTAPGDQQRLLEEIAWLRAEVERRDRELEQAAVERAELRRMLNLEQQTVAAQAQVAMITAPLPEAPAPAEEPPAPVPTPPPLVAEPATIERTLKQAGVKGKKVRKRVAEAFGVLFGR